MSTKNNHEEPWSRRFGEDENFNNRKYSRSARKSKNQEVAPLYKVLLFLFLALLIIPFATYYWSERTRTTPDPQTPEQVMVNKQKSDSESEETSSEIESSEVESSEEKSAESSSSESTQSEEDESSSSSEESVESKPDESIEEPESVPQPDEEYTNTYVVQTGDNLYRIALNHGMDLDVLKSINGIYADSIEVGSVLKVK
ncbi:MULTISPECIES: LysM peptidoglycan-binding domain-containing protein [unclassified Jeotgalibaca]|uniref:LysM peptidoglycan-binding domain-containing protein n=1 Tax=unclassified Jeotgalibaca TaxID=2621505 RepID=UPI003FD58769